MNIDLPNREIQGGGSTSMEYDYSGMRAKRAVPGGATILYPFKGYRSTQAASSGQAGARGGLMGSVVIFAIQCRGVPRVGRDICYSMRI